MVCVISCCYFFFFKQKTAYEMVMSDWSSDVCSSDLVELGDDAAMAVLAALLLHLRDAVEHEHGRQRQLRVAGAEQFPARARKQILVFELVPPFSHGTFRFLPASSTPV